MALQNPPLSFLVSEKMHPWMHPNGAGQRCVDVRTLWSCPPVATNAQANAERKLHS